MQPEGVPAGAGVQEILNEDIPGMEISNQDEPGFEFVTKVQYEPCYRNKGADVICRSTVHSDQELCCRLIGN